MKASLSPLIQALAAAIATALTLAFYVAVVYDSERIATTTTTTTTTTTATMPPAPHAGAAG